MQFTIHFGIPEMDTLWNDLVSRESSQQLDADSERLLKRLRKALMFLAADPRHPSLQSHEIEALTKRYGEKVWQSYLENRTPAAGRIYWVYGPERQQITVIGLEPHPEDHKSSYAQVVLSATPLPAELRARESRSRSNPGP
jgi:hypothetical protein